jgi:hypothetical protein
MHLDSVATLSKVLCETLTLTAHMGRDAQGEEFGALDPSRIRLRSSRLSGKRCGSRKRPVGNERPFGSVPS